MFRYDSVHDLIFGNSHSNYIRYTGKDAFLIPLNRRGERDSTLHPWSKTDKRIFRIIILGSSIGWGYPYIDGFSQRLHKKLQQVGIHNEVINCSVFSSNILNAQEIYHKKCYQYEDVNLVLLQSSIDPLALKSTVLFEKSFGKDYLYLKTILSFLPSFPIANYIYTGKYGEKVTNFSKSQKKKFQTFFTPLFPGYDYLHIVRLFENWYRWRGINQDTENLTPSQFYLHQWKTLAQPDEQSTLQMLLDLQNMVSPSHILQVLIPTYRGLFFHPLLSSQQKRNFQEQHKMCSVLNNNILQKNISFYQNYFQHYQSYLKQLKNNHIAFIDLLSVLANQKHFDKLYRCQYDDFHPNIDGYNLITTHIAHYIQQHIETGEW